MVTKTDVNKPEIMPHENTQGDLLTTIMSLFSCHTMFNIQISFCTK